MSFPRRSAATQRFTLGAPRNFVVSPDGSRVVFLRSPAGSDRATMLWVADVADRVSERVVADPRELLAGAEEVSAAERTRRERSREGAAGIVAFATDREVMRAAFALSGRLHVADLTAGRTHAPAVPGPVADPRPDPTGRQIAYVVDGAVRVVDVDGGGDRELPGQDHGPDITWGLAEFVAAEEMGRHRGFWWAPDSSGLLVARVDTAPVPRWHIADPANPARPPTEIAYPAAGTTNAGVRLHLLRLDGDPVEVSWDHVEYEYLAAVHWSGHGPPLLHVQARDQRRSLVLEVDPVRGATTERLRIAEPIWEDLVDGVPAWLGTDRPLSARSGPGGRQLMAGGDVLSGCLHLRAVLGIAEGRVLFSASEPDSPTEVHVYRSSPEGPVRLSSGPGVHTAAGAGSVTVLVSAGLEYAGRRVAVLRDGMTVGQIASYAEHPPVRPVVRMLAAGTRRIRTALLLPTHHRPGTRLPVLLDPYGGPHAQRVLCARNGFNEPQWWADQGFAVVVADGRGTSGRDPDWERAVHGDLAGPVLEDQIEALHAAAAHCADLDLQRVGIRGWSFGGFLAALAVLRRPDVFHAGIAGAPVTDWTLYDTHYTERYLGTPSENPDAYTRSSLVTGGVLAPDLHPRPGEPVRPLLLVHGLADDNVVAAHTLQLSAALLAAGRPHQVLPLSGVTHMTPQEVVAENLLLLQLDFLRKSLH